MTHTSFPFPFFNQVLIFAVPFEYSIWECVSRYPYGVQNTHHTNVLRAMSGLLGSAKSCNWSLCYDCMAIRSCEDAWTHQNRNHRNYQWLDCYHLLCIKGPSPLRIVGMTIHRWRLHPLHTHTHHTHTPHAHTHTHVRCDMIKSDISTKHQLQKLCVSWHGIQVQPIATPTINSLCTWYTHSCMHVDGLGNVPLCHNDEEVCLLDKKGTKRFISCGISAYIKSPVKKLKELICPKM